MNSSSNESSLNKCPLAVETAKLNDLGLSISYVNVFMLSLIKLGHDLGRLSYLKYDISTISLKEAA